MEHLEKLCMLLHCTPNDVLEWKADQNVALSQDHPLYSLIRRENAELHSFLKNASLEELGKLQEFISQIKKENGNTK